MFMAWIIALRRRGLRVRGIEFARAKTLARHPAEE